jgi:5-hydroxyisourate hydrolase-like protein (transthyretin family)
MNRLKHHIHNTYTLLLAWMLLSLALYQCAQPVMPEGGPRDEQEPILIEKGSTPNFQINFTEQKIEFEFDEFIKLDDPVNQIIISPPTEFPIQRVLKGKKLIVRFDPKEVLLENTTYSIQFGEAIKDITESNAVKNLRYVFSTGSYIDSLSIVARVLDTESGEPAENVLVILHENTGDSALLIDKPAYFTRTDSAGIGNLENLKEGFYKIYALEEENNNYLFDTQDERIAFLDRRVKSRYRPSQITELLLFKDIEPPIVIDGYRRNDSLWSFVIQGDKQYLEWELENADSIYTSWLADSLFMWFVDPVDTSNIYFGSDYGQTDTFQLLKLDQSDAGGTAVDKLKHSNIIVQQGETDNILSINWNLPIIKIDTVNIMYKDTGGAWLPLQYTLDSSSIGSMRTLLSWNTPKIMDSLIIEPNAFQSFALSSDSIVYKVRYRKQEDVSGLIVQFKDLDSASIYLVELQNKSGNIIETTIVRDTSAKEWTLKNLQPLDYKLVIVKDENRNGRWDGGFFMFRQVPEPRYEQEVRNLRPDWDVLIESKPGF